MTLPAPTYDLVLILDLQTEEADRAKIVADARSAIEAQGELLRYDAWGERVLTYPIEKKMNGEYHLFQFHVGANELLSGLDRNLRITDGVLRFRIIKLAPGVPAAPDMGSSSAAPRRTETEPQAESVPEAEPAETAPAEAPVAEPA